MHKFLAALRIRSFLFLWLAELFSQIAMNMMNFILILIAFSLTNSNTAVSGIVLSFTIPSIIFGILAGVYVDRWNKKLVLFWTNIIRCGLLIVLAFFHKELAFLYTISFFVAIVTQFFIPAETPMIPILVGGEHLFAANALFSMAWFGSVFIAYALSGPFLLLFGSTTALIILAAIFLIASIFSLIIKLPKIKKDTRYKIPVRQAQGRGQDTKYSFSITHEIKNALKTIFGIRDVKHGFLLLVLTQTLTLIISVVGPGYAKNILHININEFPLIFVTPAVIGMAVGSYVVTNYFHRFSRHKSATLGLFLAASIVSFMPYASLLGNNIVGAVVLAVLLGVANSFMFVPSNTLVQEQTSDAMRGKIYGTLNSVSSLLSLLPVIVVGSLADIVGVSGVLTGIGVLIGIIAVMRLTL